MSDQKIANKKDKTNQNAMAYKLDEKIEKAPSNLPSFISDNKPTYLVGGVESTHLIAEINNLNSAIKTDEFSYENEEEILKQNDYEVAEHVNIMKRHQKDLNQEMKKLNEEFKFTQEAQEQKIKQKKANIKVNNLDHFGNPIFKTDSEVEGEKNLDEELDYELAILEKTINMKVPNYQKSDNVQFEAETQPIEPEVPPLTKAVQKDTLMENQPSKEPQWDTTITSETYASKPEVNDKELLLIKAKIELAKVETQKAEAEAKRAKAEAEFEYYKTQNVQMQQKKRWLKGKNRKNKEVEKQK